MSAKEIAEKLAYLLEQSHDDGLASVRTFEEAGIRADPGEEGFTIRYDDNSKYEILVTES